MLFNSYIFILLFLPITLLGYFGLNKFNKFKLSKAFLVIMSLVFYSYFNYSYLFIILTSIVFNYIFSRLMRSFRENPLKKIVFIFSIAFNVGILFYFKYFDFFISNINAVFSTDYALRNIVLPLGISFFTFQQLSFIIDSYKNDIPEYSFIDYAVFVSFFPQLIAGPIALHDEIIPQFADESKKRINFENFSKGIYAFAFGLAKKVLVADAFGRVVDLAYADTDYFLNTTNALFVILAYTIQIYFDFSGYCDMSTGLGLMFNIDMPINFNSPYKALDNYDFWKRWHITLTRFFTKYIYIPLGGNRKGIFRTYINTFIVFTIRGIWHGANWTFIIWGIIHGFADIAAKALQDKLKKIPKFVRWFFNFIFLNMTWVIFRADSIHQALFIFKRVIMMNFESLSDDLINQLLGDNISFISSSLDIHSWINCLVAVLFSMLIVVVCLKCKNTNERINDFKSNTKEMVISIVFISASILSFSGISSFLYFNF